GHLCQLTTTENTDLCHKFLVTFLTTVMGYQGVMIPQRNLIKGQIMMQVDENMKKDAKLWEDYLLSWTDSQQALMRLYHGLSDRVEFMRDQFAENAHHPILWDMMMILPSDELM